MKEKCKHISEKLKYNIRKLRKVVVEYIATNRLFILYVILAMASLMAIRYLTIGTMFSWGPIICDFALVLIIGSFGYLVKPKNQNKYFLIVLIIFAIIEMINSIYYKFYFSFASIGELSTVSQTETVTGSIFERMSLLDFIYLLFPLIFYLAHKHIVKTAYYNLMSKVEKGKKMFGVTMLVGCIFLAYTFVSATSTDYSRLSKQWYRSYIVQRFGLILYHGNDLIQSLTPKLNSLFGYDEASQKFIQYYTDPDYDKYDQTNKYTNILNGYNIIFVHMEGMQTYLMDVEFNGVEATPNLKKIASEGMFFSNFYPQISTGTSSDTEFTLLTSLLPASSSTVFMSYYDRDYITLPKLLKEKGYSTFSMHGNKADMWNRRNVHPKLGYEDMFFEESFEYNNDLDDPNNTDVINLGISDKLFFEQAIPILEEYEETHTNYMGTIITLSNHSPFIYQDKYGEYDMSTTFEDCDEYGICEAKTTDYLNGTAVGKYITSSHYADAALGEFFEYINESEYFENTVFVLYGDHDVKLNRSQVEYLYNYDYKTGELKTEDDPDYIEYDAYDHELNKNTPLIIWTKNKELKKTFKGEVNYVMGMYDVMPTIGNMLGVKNEFAIGHDIFSIKNDNVVVFASGNFVTNLVYYNNSTGQYKVLKDGAELSSDYVSNLISKTEKMLDVSNAIEVHDLIALEGDNVRTIRERKEE